MEESSKWTCFRCSAMTISLRLIVVIIVGIVAVSCTAIVLVPFYSTSLNAVRRTVESLRAETVLRVADHTQRFFMNPIAATHTAASTTHSGLFPPSNITLALTTLCNLAITTNIGPFFAGYDDGSTAYCSNVQPDQIISAFFMVPRAPQLAMFSPRADMRCGESRCVADVYSVELRRRDFSILSMRWVEPTSFDPRTRPWYSPALSGTLWSTPYVDARTRQSVLTAGAALRNASGMAYGALAVDIFPSTLNQVLRGINTSVGTVIVAEVASRSVFAASVNMSVVAPVYNTSETQNRSSEFLIPIGYRLPTIADIPHGDAHVVLREFGEGPLYRWPSPVHITFNADDKKRYYLDIDDVASAGLTVRIILIVTDSNFTGDVTDSLQLVLIVVIAAAAVIMFLSALFSWLITQPLETLNDRMLADAKLNYDGEVKLGSWLSEIHEIEKTYLQMRNEHKRLKGFLPQSVMPGDEPNPLVALIQVEDDLAVESDRAEDELSSIGDSQGSTSRTASRLSSPRAAGTADEHWAVRGRGGLVSPLHSLGISHRRVTIMAVNVANFHGHIAKNLMAAIGMHEDLLGKIEEVVQHFRGVVEGFHGDHVFVHYNASVMCSGHPLRASRAALQIKAIANALQPTPCQLTIGIATGEAHFGNFGTCTVKRFSIIGPVYNQAYLLERMCKVYDVSSLVTPSTASAAAAEIFLKALDVVQLPDAPAPEVVSTLLAAKPPSDIANYDGMQNVEWMYDLGRHDGADEETSLTNGIWGHLASNEIVAAKALAVKLGDPSTIKHTSDVQRALVALNSANLSSYVKSRHRDLFSQIFSRPGPPQPPRRNSAARSPPPESQCDNI